MPSRVIVALMTKIACLDHSLFGALATFARVLQGFGRRTPLTLGRRANDFHYRFFLASANLDPDDPYFRFRFSYCHLSSPT